MRKLIASLMIVLVVLIPATIVFAHERALSTTTFYACEAVANNVTVPVGEIDPGSITQDSAGLFTGCTTDGPYSLLVNWSVTGPIGQTGPTGTQGIQGVPGPAGSPGATGTQGPIGLTGATGATGPAGIPYTHPACTEVLTNHREEQENMVFCVSGVEPDGGAVWKAAIACANVAVMVGTPSSDNPSVDWGGAPLPHYVQFGNGIHAEAHADGIIRFYSGNKQVC